ncbi:pikAII, partial [Symbiodinium sp. KB8]
MESILGAKVDRSSVVAVACVKWRSFLSPLPEVPSFLDNFRYAAKDRTNGKLLVKGSAPSRDLVRTGIENVLKEVLGADLDDFSVPLMDMGLDSLAAVEFRNRIQCCFEGVRLSSTVMFDYPTVGDLTDFILSQFAPDDDVANVDVKGRPDTMLREPLALMGMAGRCPGMAAGNDISDFWAFLCSERDPISRIPIERFDVDEFYDEDRSAPGRVYVRQGGFINDVDLFDAAFFGIAKPEARSMDKHHRLQLEIVFESFYNSGFTKESLVNLECGAFIGCCSLAFARVVHSGEVDDIGPFTNIGSSLSGMAGRVSHALALRGPCFTVDTACSSTLVATDCAMQAFHLGRQVLACVAGTNLQLRQGISSWIGFCKMGALSGDGRCKTFDESADGFGRSEGSGSFILSPKSEGTLAHMMGSCVNQDGRSATITAPSGPAQQRALNNSLRDSELTPLQVSLIECHGTGTALGDPIEIGALENVYGRDRLESAQLILAAVKSVTAHPEGAAGIVGLAKLVKMMQHGQVPANLHLHQLNPNIDLSSFECKMPDCLLDWSSAPRLSGISSFAFSGTNCHINMQEASPGEMNTMLSAAEARAPLIWSRSMMSRQDRMRFRQVRPEQTAPGSASAEAKMLEQGVEDVEEDILTVEWAVAEGSPGKAIGATGNGVVFVGAAEKLSSSLKNMLPEASFLETAADSTFEGTEVAVLLAASQDADEMQVLFDALLLVQAAMALAAKGHQVPKIAYFTFRTQDAPKRGAGSYLHAGLWGLARTARLEDASLGLYCFDLDVPDPDDADATAQVILEQLGSIGGVETELALSEGPYVPRLCRCQVQPQKPMRLEMKSRGSLSNLREVPLQRTSPDADQVELRVRAVGLNFRDVLNVMDLYPGDPGNPGGDCAGTVCTVGERETRLRPGQDVFGIAPGCLQAFACTEGLLMVPKPKRWSFEQMVAWPVTFATAEEAFVELAPLKLGER